MCDRPTIEVILGSTSRRAQRRVRGLARGEARKQRECAYSLKYFFSPLFVVFLCAARPFEGRSTCRASS